MAKTIIKIFSVTLVLIGLCCGSILIGSLGMVCLFSAYGAEDKIKNKLSEENQEAENRPML